MVLISSLQVNEAVNSTSARHKKSFRMLLLRQVSKNQPPSIRFVIHLPPIYLRTVPTCDMCKNYLDTPISAQRKFIQKLLIPRSKKSKVRYKQSLR